LPLLNDLEWEWVKHLTQLDVVTFGEAMVLFMADQTGPLHQVRNFTKGLAGAETNVAVGLSRLGYRVGWVSKVGADPFGEYIKETLQAEGVDLSHVRTDTRRPTGFQLKEKAVDRDPQVHYFRKGSAASSLGPEDFVPAYFMGASHLHMTGIPPALSITAREFAECALSAMKAARRTVSFDPNLRPSLWESPREMVEVVNRFAAQADWVLPGIAEGRTLTGYEEPRDIAAFYLDLGARLVVVKLGPKGAYVRTADGEGIVPGFSVDRVVDTVGAGDGFAVGVISGLLGGLPVEDAVRRGNAIGAMAVTVLGDMDGLPTREELETFMFARE
jgi:sugar/nucleoside kinase (ribokinase family)